MAEWVVVYVGKRPVYDFYLGYEHGEGPETTKSLMLARKWPSRKMAMEYIDGYGVDRLHVAEVNNIDESIAIKRMEMMITGEGEI